MSFIFGGTPTKQGSKGNSIRDYQTELRHTCRSMEREEAKTVATEKKLQAAIQRSAKEGRFDLCSLKAKELVRLRSHRNRLITMRGYMTTLAQQLSTVQSTQTMAVTIEKTTKLLSTLNGQRNPAQIAKILNEFERQNSYMQGKQEIIEDSLDSIFETDREQENIDEAVAQVYTELGLDSALAFAAANIPHPMADPSKVPDDGDIETRLAKLRTRG